MNSERYINRSMSIISSDWLCSWCGQLEFSKSGWLHYGQIEHEIERECFWVEACYSSGGACSTRMASNEMREDY